MKKSLLVLTTLLVSMTLMAGNVTEQEANQLIDFLALYAMIVYNAMKDDGTDEG